MPAGIDSQFALAANDIPHAGRETVQVDLWQQWRNPTTRAVAESYSLPRSLERVLKGAQLTTSPTHTWGVRFISSRRILERDTNLVHTAMTVEVDRDI